MEAGRRRLTPGSYTLASFRRALRMETAEEKVNILHFFMCEFPVELVSQVIERILDDTVSPRHGDTGRGKTHHQAAMAMSEFARRFDGISLVERGRFNYSFYDDGGVGTEQRRRQVHSNWLRWWQANKRDRICRMIER